MNTYAVRYSTDAGGWCVVELETDTAVSEPRKRLAQAERDFHNDGWYTKTQQAIAKRIQDGK